MTHQSTHQETTSNTQASCATVAVATWFFFSLSLLYRISPLINRPGSRIDVDGAEANETIEQSKNQVFSTVETRQMLGILTYWFGGGQENTRINNYWLTTQQP